VLTSTRMSRPGGVLYDQPRLLAAFLGSGAVVLFGGAPGLGPFAPLLELGIYAPLTRQRLWSLLATFVTRG
jgi:hypothetical protein